MGADDGGELLAIRGTPEFEEELRRQALATAEQDRKNGYPNRFEPDWEWLDRYWKMKRGDIVTVALFPPFAKPRPAVIIQARLLDSNENVTVAHITSDLARSTANRVLVQPTEGNGLRKLSEVTLDLILTTPLERVSGHAGTLEPENMRRVDAALRLFLGI